MSDERGVTVSRPQPLARAPDPPGGAPAVSRPSGRPGTTHPQYPSAKRAPAALTEVRQLERQHPHGRRTREQDRQIQQAYKRAYPEDGAGGTSKEAFTPHPETVAEVSGQADALSPAEGRKLRAEFDEWVRGGGEDEDAALGTFPIKSYAAKWGSYQPNHHDERQWTKAVSVAAKIGVSPKQLGALRDALLQDVPSDAGGDYSPDDYSVPFSIPDDASWAVFKMARGIAAEHGVHPAAFSEMAAAVLGANEGLAEPQRRRLQAAGVDALVLQYGDRAVKLVEDAQKAVGHFGFGGLKEFFEQPMASGVAVGDHSQLIELLGRVGAAIAHDAAPGEFSSASGIYENSRSKSMNGRYSVSASTRQEALAAIRKLEREHPSHGASYRYPEVQAERDRLYRIAYPEPEKN